MTTRNLNQQTAPAAATAKRSDLLLLLCLAVALLLSPHCFAQGLLEGQYKTIPLHGNSPAQALQESADRQTVPMWQYSVTSPKDGQFYTGLIMGGNWFLPVSYVVRIVLVPLIVNLRDSSGNVAYTYDPTATSQPCAGSVEPLTAVEASPLFDLFQVDYKWGNPPIDLGPSQYVDALLRAQFWTVGHTPPHFGGHNYYDVWHNIFEETTIGAVTVDVPFGYWGRISLPCVGSSGAIDFTWFDHYIQSTLIPSLANQGVGPLVFPVFLTYNVATSPNQGTTIYLGYHGAYGSPMQIYAEGMFDLTGAFSNSHDITPLSHELAEAMNDPTGTNATPAWGNIGQVNGCQSNFEVGDPLSGTEYPSITLNGYTYHPQEMAFFGWFFDKWPPTLNWGIPGWYSNNGKLTGTAKVCPPGGTN